MMTDAELEMSEEDIQKQRDDSWEEEELEEEYRKRLMKESQDYYEKTGGNEE